MSRLFQVSADATLSLYADDRWLDLKCKVVRCTETDVQLSGATWKRKEFETAVSFDDPTIIAALLAPEGRA